MQAAPSKCDSASSSRPAPQETPDTEMQMRQRDIVAHGLRVFGVFRTCRLAAPLTAQSRTASDVDALGAHDLLDIVLRHRARCPGRGGESRPTNQRSLGAHDAAALVDPDDISGTLTMHVEAGDEMIAVDQAGIVGLRHRPTKGVRQALSIATASTVKPLSFSSP